MRAIKQSFKYGITSALLVIVMGSVQACADVSPMEPNTSPVVTRQFSVEGDSLGPKCVLIDDQWRCPSGG